ncbi:MAG: TetR family transcriptional regulator [Corynebacterium sp.]|nr:TetR family transcriptional regulator [Corynebacterium sp.]
MKDTAAIAKVHEEIKKMSGARAQEILDAAVYLFDEHHYKDISLKDIAVHTSMSRPSIYNYFQTKGEIFLALLTREYLQWAEELANVPVTAEFTLAVVQQLAGKDLMFKLIANNITEFEEESRDQNILTFKYSYLATMENFEKALVEHYPHLTSAQSNDIVLAFFPYLFGVYPYTTITQRQQVALDTLTDNFPQSSAQDLLHNLLHTLVAPYAIADDSPSN